MKGEYIVGKMAKRRLSLCVGALSALGLASFNLHAATAVSNNAIGFGQEQTRTPRYLVRPSAAQKAVSGKESGKECEPKNAIAFDGDDARVSDLKRWWQFGSISYLRKVEDFGSVVARYNRAHRNGFNGNQYQLEAYPVISKDLYLSLIYAYAPTSQVLFPTRRYVVEADFSAGGAFDFGFGHQGQIYQNLSDQKIWSYYGFVGKQFGNFYFMLKDTYYSTKNLNFGEAGVRYMFCGNDKFFVELKGNIGRIPDFQDLPPLDQMIVIKQRGAYFGGQVPFWCDTLLVRAGVGYSRQRISPHDTKRNITDYSAGITWLF